EVVKLFIQKKVEEADKSRRTGEDWLFGAGEDAWTKSRLALVDAKKQYDKIAGDAHIIREALQARDQTLAGLPYYARWLATRRLTNDKLQRPRQQKELEERLKRVIEVGRDVDVLATRLQEAAAAKNAADKDLREWKE